MAAHSWLARRATDPIDAAFAEHDEQLARAFPDAPSSHLCWRWKVAGLPAEQWRRWRHCTDAILKVLDRPTADEIAAADKLAADILCLLGDRPR